MIGFLLMSICFSSGKASAESGHLYWTYELSMYYEPTAYGDLLLRGNATWTYVQTRTVKVDGNSYYVNFFDYCSQLEATGVVNGSYFHVRYTESGYQYQETDSSAIVKRDISTWINTTVDTDSSEAISSSSSRVVTIYSPPFDTRLRSEGGQMNSWNETVAISTEKFEEGALRERIVGETVNYTFVLAPEEVEVTTRLGTYSTAKLSISDEHGDALIYYYSKHISTNVRSEYWKSGETMPWKTYLLVSFNNGQNNMSQSLALFAVTFAVAGGTAAFVAYMLRRKDRMAYDASASQRTLHRQAQPRKMLSSTLRATVYCKHCGHQLELDSSFCSECGRRMG
jgi:hypothetical protein